MEQINKCKSIFEKRPGNDEQIARQYSTNTENWCQIERGKLNKYLGGNQVDGLPLVSSAEKKNAVAMPERPLENPIRGKCLKLFEHFKVDHELYIKAFNSF